jgi:hypothetical protein
VSKDLGSFSSISLGSSLLDLKKVRCDVVSDGDVVLDEDLQGTFDLLTSDQQVNRLVKLIVIDKILRHLSEHLHILFFPDVVGDLLDVVIQFGFHCQIDRFFDVLSFHVEDDCLFIEAFDFEVLRTLVHAPGLGHEG